MRTIDWALSERYDLDRTKHRREKHLKKKSNPRNCQRLVLLGRSTMAAAINRNITAAAAPAPTSDTTIAATSYTNAGGGTRGTTATVA